MDPNRKVEHDRNVTKLNREMGVDGEHDFVHVTKGHKRCLCCFRTLKSNHSMLSGMLARE
jgi:hypothetical protein